MTYVYTPKEADALEKQRAETAKGEGKPAETSEERERIWRLLVSSAVRC